MLIIYTIRNLENRSNEWPIEIYLIIEFVIEIIDDIAHQSEIRTLMVISLMKLKLNVYN